MKFAINLKSYPGAEYFTVRDHRFTFKTLEQYDTIGVYDRIVATLRRLHGIPADFSAITIREGQKSDVHAKFKNHIERDNPAAGINQLAGSSPEIPGGSILDLSYSFPLTVENADAFEGIFVDTRASLGIPVDASFLFARTGLEGIAASALLPAELYLLDKVLQDIDNKGIALIVRETNYKAAVLYQLLEDCKHLHPAADRKNRSKTMICATCDRAFAEKIVKLGYVVEISGSSVVNMIIANYATHSKEMMEVFSDRIMGL